jgi:DNA repair protein RadC
MQSRFSHGQYRGYEVRLELKRRGRRYDPVELSTPESAYRFMKDLSRESSEYVYNLYLDTKHRVTDVYLVGKGGCQSALVDPKDVFKAALAVNSPAYIMVHNHPSGMVEPSAEDMALARRLSAAGSLLAIQLVDSIIIGDGHYRSLRDYGVI